MATTCPNPREKWSVHWMPEAVPAQFTDCLSHLPWSTRITWMASWTKYYEQIMKKIIAYPCNPIPTIHHYIFIWETHGFWHIQRSMDQSSDAPSGSANDEIQRPPMVLPRCLQGGESVRSQETRRIYCQTYPKMNSSCMIMWLLHVTLHVQYIESWMHVFYISLPGCWIIELSDDIYIYSINPKFMNTGWLIYRGHP